MEKTATQYIVEYITSQPLYKPQQNPDETFMDKEKNLDSKRTPARLKTQG